MSDMSIQNNSYNVMRITKISPIKFTNDNAKDKHENNKQSEFEKILQRSMHNDK